MTTWIGVNAQDGTPLSDREHLRQSIWDILMTRRGERVMRPEYGSDVFELISKPVNERFLVDLYYEAIVAIHRWEPRVRVSRINGEELTDGRIILELTASLDGGLAEQIRLDALTL